MASKVLVADDEPGIVTLLETLLQVKGFEVVTAFTGTEALDKALREKPDVILLDVVMPGLAGYQVFEKLQEDLYAKHIPVFVMSARKNMVNLFPPSHLITFVSKPFDTEALIDKVVQAVALQKTHEERTHALRKMLEEPTVVPQGTIEKCKNVLILGSRDFLVGKIKELFVEKGYQVTTASGEDDAIQKCATLAPKYFFCEFREVPDLLDAEMVYQKMKHGVTLGKLHFFIYCRQDLLPRAELVFPSHLIVSYNESKDLLEKIGKILAK